jgi:hypothetical protein
MTISLFNRAVATSLVSLYRTEKEIRVRQTQEDDLSSRDRHLLAQVELENARAIRLAQSAMAGASLDILV